MAIVRAEAEDVWLGDTDLSTKSEFISCVIFPVWAQEGRVDTNGRLLSGVKALSGSFDNWRAGDVSRGE